MIILIKIRKPHPLAHKHWKHSLYLKFGMMFPLNPSILKWFLGLFGYSGGIQGGQIILVILMLLLSVFTRFYREDVTKFFSVIDEFNKFEDVKEV